MKQRLSIILCIVVAVSVLVFAAVAANAESDTMKIVPSRYGAWENWINSPNIMVTMILPHSFLLKQQLHPVKL